MYVSNYVQKDKETSLALPYMDRGASKESLWLKDQ